MSERDVEAVLDHVCRRLRVNSIAWHTKFHAGAWETCTESSCTNDHEAFRARAEFSYTAAQEREEEPAVADALEDAAPSSAARPPLREGGER